MNAADFSNIRNFSSIEKGILRTTRLEAIGTLRDSGGGVFFMPFFVLGKTVQKMLCKIPQNTSAPEGRKGGRTRFLDCQETLDLRARQKGLKPK